MTMRNQIPASSYPALVAVPPVAHARFAIGEVVKHRMFDFRGVVFDVDPASATGGAYPIALVSYLIGCEQYEDATVAELVGRPVGSIGPTRQRCLDRLRALVLESDPNLAWEG